MTDAMPNIKNTLPKMAKPFIRLVSFGGPLYFMRFFLADAKAPDTRVKRKAKATPTLKKVIAPPLFFGKLSVEYSAVQISPTRKRNIIFATNNR